MKLLVTGGCGFLGAHLVEHFLKATDAEIIVLDKMTYASSGFDRLRDIQAFDDKRVRVLGCDLSQPVPEGIAREIGEVDYIIHAAAETHVDNSIVDPLPFLMSNVIGTHHLLWWMRSLKSLRRAFLVSCYDAETRALTAEGFKRYDELAEGDVVFGIDTNGALVEQQVQKVIVQQYEGEMISFRTPRVDLCVTPNHRMYGSENGQVTVEEAAQTAGRNVALKLPRPTPFSGPAPQTIHVEGIGDLPSAPLAYVCGLFIGDGFVSDQLKERPNKSGLPFHEMIKINRDPSTGRIISRHGVGDRTVHLTQSYRVFFDIPVEDPARERLREALRQLNVDFSEHSGKSGTHVYIGDKRWSDFFRQFGHGAHNKRIPRWLLSLDATLLEKLFDGLIDSDGHWRSNPQYTTVSEGLVGDVCELAVKLGKLPRFQKNHNASVIDGRRVAGEAFYIYCSQKLDPELSSKDAIEDVYNGVVWCVSVPMKNLIVERHGRLAVCGNTDETYGPASLEDKENAFDENAPFRPANPYAAAKAGGECVAMAYANTYKLPITVAATMNLVAERQHFEKYVPLVIRKVMQGETVTIHSNPERTKSGTRFYLHCRTYAHALGFLIDRDQRGEAMPPKINICGEREISNLELAELIASIVGKPLKYELVDFHSSRPGHDLAYRMNDSLIRSLGWNRPMNLEQSLDKTVRWYLANPKWLGL